MRKDMPTIMEDADGLKRQFKAERHPAKRQRLQALYLLASQQAHSRSELATMLGISRNTIAVWLRTYAAGGLPALLQVYVPAGKPPTLTAPQLAQLTARLAEPTGESSYVEVQRWLNTTFGLDLTYNAVHKLVRYTLGAKLKVPRPSHPKKMERIATFEASFATQLRMRFRQTISSRCASGPVTRAALDSTPFGAVV